MWQPMKVSTILDQTFKTYRAKFLEYSLYSLLIWGTVTLLISLLLPGATRLQSTVSLPGLVSAFESGDISDIFTSFQPVNYSSIIEMLLSFLSVSLSFLSIVFVLPLITGGIVFITLAVFHGTEEVIKSSFSMVVKLYGRLLLTSFAQMAIYVLAGLALLVIMIPFIIFFVISASATGSGVVILLIIFTFVLMAGLFFAVMVFFSFLMFVFPVTILENKVGFKPIGRAWRLFWRKKWKTIGLFLLSYLMTSVITWIFSSLGLFLPILINTIINSAVHGLVMPIPIIAFTYLYMDIRMTTEGYDLELRAGANAKKGY